MASLGGHARLLAAPHSPSSSNGDDNGKTSEEHSGASRAMAELQRNAAGLLE